MSSAGTGPLVRLWLEREREREREKERLGRSTEPAQFGFFSANCPNILTVCLLQIVCEGQF